MPNQKKKICRQMTLVKFDCLEVIPPEDVKRKLHRKFAKLVSDSKISEIREELNIVELQSDCVNNNPKT